MVRKYAFHSLNSARTLSVDNRSNSSCFTTKGCLGAFLFFRLGLVILLGKAEAEQDEEKEERGFGAETFGI